MADPEVTFLGAAGTVTGACYLLSVGGDRVLVDCGLFQGSRTIEALNREPFAFDARKIVAVLLTHAHLDHSGLLPRLYAEGFRGEIWCTAATADLLTVMLPDAAKIHEQDVERRNRRWDRADEAPIEPLYRKADAEGALELRRVVRLDEMLSVTPHIQARFWNAGHILGSASIEVVANGVSLAFSGDIGPANKSFHAEPEGPSGVDHLFCESTYGDRQREPVTIDERRAILEEEVKRALKAGGNLVIPVFALERTQELLLDLGTLLVSGRIGQFDVFIDSPLASRATDVFRRHRMEMEDVEGREVFNHPRFHFVESVAVSIRLDQVSGAVILAASGMCEGGRVRHHLCSNLPRADSTILFVGFQAKGTLGRTIVDGARRVRISGHDVAVRASIRRIDCYSAHADQGELLDWIARRRPIAGSLFLVHGEQGALHALSAMIGAQQGPVVIPEIGEVYQLARGAAAKRLRTGRVELRDALGGDWQNRYADLAVNLKRDLQRIESDERRIEALAQMREILDRFGARSKAGQHKRPG